MHANALVLAGLISIGHGHESQTRLRNTQRADVVTFKTDLASHVNEIGANGGSGTPNALQIFAMLLMAVEDPMVGWHVPIVGHGRNVAVLNLGVTHTQPHIFPTAWRLPVGMSMQLKGDSDSSTTSEDVQADESSEPLRFEVCQNKYCRKRGSAKTLAMMKEMAAGRTDVLVEAADMGHTEHGCFDECTMGPNVRVGGLGPQTDNPPGKIINGVKGEDAIAELLNSQE